MTKIEMEDYISYLRECNLVGIFDLRQYIIQELETFNKIFHKEIDVDYIMREINCKGWMKNDN